MENSVKFIGKAHETTTQLVQQPNEQQEMFLRMCTGLGFKPRTMFMLSQYADQLIECMPTLQKCQPTLERLQTCAPALERFPQECSRLEELVAQCNRFEKLMKYLSCCPQQQQFGNVTTDYYSSITTVDLEKITTGLGDPYVDQFPVPTSKIIRLVQTAPRPGYVPEQIEINMVMANNATNYLNLTVQFYVGERKIGSAWKGSHFLDQDGRTKKVPFPTFRDEVIVIGSDDTLAVEISVSGPNSLEYAAVTIHIDGRGTYALCTPCT